MAEALALIGLVSNIFGFIEVGVSLVSAVHSLRDASKLPDIRELDSMLDIVQGRSDDARRRLGLSGAKMPKNESQILKMADECVQVAAELRKHSKTLSKTDKTRHPTLANVRIAVQFQFSKKEINELRGRLIKMDRIVRDNMVEALQRYACSAFVDLLRPDIQAPQVISIPEVVVLTFHSDRHSEVMHSLKSLNQVHNDYDIKYDIKLDAIRDAVIAATKMADHNQIDINQHSAHLVSLQTKLTEFEKELAVCNIQATTIKSLYFTALKRRWFQIPFAETRTNAWLFDPSQTNFASWAESPNVHGIYCISGLAGSGKSTLMKFAFDHPKTIEHLSAWAYPSKLCMASYFFWNQGFEMQKSRTGLLQSLLYQILRYIPDLIPMVCADRLHHEAWDFEELKTALTSVTTQTTLPIRFCFFIDGLDEYNGEEEDISKLLLSLAHSPHIKICASSRPRSVFDDTLWSPKFYLQVQDLTKEDMRRSVRKTLMDNPNFRALSGSEPTAQHLMDYIADHARGVWLWVFLVSRDLIYAVNRKEGLHMLQTIVDSFPQDLEEYFTRIINNIRPVLRDEMARIFLITLGEVQPLPLFAFSLLERELDDPGYATKTAISPLDDSEVREIDLAWKVRIHNRCGDLLVVNDGEHPAFLQRPVDFLHRTVRDFLQDCYYDNIQAELKYGFNAPLSLCRMMLYFLKKQPRMTSFSNPKDLNRIMNLVDELLYYAYEAERSNQLEDSELNDILDQVDSVVGTFTQGLRNHWTHARDSPRARDLDEYREGGNCNYLALTIQARLVKFVRAKLAADPRRMHKRGRPLLDYALRPRRVTPLKTPYHSRRDEPNISVGMVRLLLEQKVDPNQRVFLNDDRTVWALFLISCSVSVRRGEFNEASRTAWYKASDLMIEHGASLHCFGPIDPLGFQDIEKVLGFVFGQQKAEGLIQKMREKESERAYYSWGGWLYRNSGGLIGRSSD